MNQTVGLKRNTSDKFYTNSSTVEICLNTIKQYLHISPNDLIIEPSAGNGAFIRGIKTLSNHYRFYDLEPEHEDVIQQDYLKLDSKKLLESHKLSVAFTENSAIVSSCNVIGNPPFGRQSSLAIKFIKKSCEFCDSVSFILPKSFKKESLRKSFPLNFHLIVEIDLPKDSFLVNGQEYNVDTVFQIWAKKDHLREVVETVEPANFKFVKISENPDISFRRVGVYAGKIDIDIVKSEQSHYFIKFTNDKSINDNLEALKQVRFEHNNTVGPRSISKPELIAEFNKYTGGPRSPLK
jgi:predicted RNA methylase